MASSQEPVRVWAPYASTVEVVLGDREPQPLQPEPGRPGWWSWSQPHRGSYAFVIDGVTRPDPRAQDQPDVLVGPSRTVDHDTYRWQDAGWRGRPLASTVIYELHVGTFSPEGTYAGVQAHLDHLVELGVGAVELLPLNGFPGRWGWGYDGVAWFAPYSAYGTPDELKALVDACHARGLAVIIDVVYNHVGPSGNHLWAYGPYFTDLHHTPWGPALNADGPDSDEVRRFVLDNVTMWLRDYHADGLRLDAVHAIVDLSARHLLEEMAEEVARLELALDRTLWLIAESDRNDPQLVRPRAANGFGLDAQWADDLHHAVHVALTGERQAYYADFVGLVDVATAWTQGFVRDGRYSPSLRRHHGRKVDPGSSRRLVTALQNHDQIGNRARGDRIGHLVGAARQRIGAVLTLLAPSVPLLFQGEEWAASSPFQYFTDHQDPELAEAVRQGRRREFAAFGWRPEDVADPQDPSTFRASVLRWPERHDGEHAEMLRWYQQLIALRHDHPIMAEDVRVLEVDERVLHAHLGPLTVVLNLGPGDTQVALARSATPALSSGAVTVLSGATPTGSASDPATPDTGFPVLGLGPDSIAVLIAASTLRRGDE